MGVKLITDSTSYIPGDIRKKYDIRVASLNVTMDGKSYRELDLKNEEFYIEMDKSSEIPKSAQPGMEEMIELFKDAAKEGNDIVAVFISSKMSGTYSTAHLIKNMILEEYPDIRIEIIDSKTNCMEMGFSVIEGAKAAYEGKGIEDVVKRVEYVRECGKFLFTPDTLKYLKKGGRIGGAAALFGSILQIRPILTVVDGTTEVFDKVRTKKRAVDTIINKVVSDMNERGLGDLIVHHINCEEEGIEIANRLSEKLGVKVGVQSIGPIIGLHVGPGSVGVAYFTRNSKEM